MPSTSAPSRTSSWPASGTLAPGGSSLVIRTRATEPAPYGCPGCVRSADAEAACRRRDGDGVLLRESPEQVVGEVDRHPEPVALVAVVVQPVSPPHVAVETLLRPVAR